MISFAIAVGHLGHLGRARRATPEVGVAGHDAEAPATTAVRAETFRPDIEGLRGIAILLVLLFHSDLVPLPGGFVGVDVFFVISGFLITGLLLRERERTGRISFATFYARRIRRLMPAAIVVIVAILAVAAVVVAPLDRPGVSLDGAAAAISVANLRFAAQQGDYFTALASPSPFTHFWSLGVEEQFYLVWPALLLLGARGRRPRVGAAIVLCGVLVASFAACLIVTEVAPSWAFYMLPTRAWQLATGGLLAIGAIGLARLPGLPMAALGWAGLAAVLVAPFVLDSSMAYPGALALLPTLGAGALIASGERRWSPGRILAVAPLRFLGRISYSLYLWHWPILVLPLLATGAPLTPAVRAGLVVASLVVATMSWACIEEPFRRGRPRVLARTPRTLAFAVVALAAVVVTSGGMWYGQERALDMIGAAQTGIASGDAGSDIDWTAQSPDPSGMAVDPGSLPAAGLDDTATPDPATLDEIAAPDPTTEPGDTPLPSASATPPPPTPGPTAAPTNDPTPAPKVSYVLPSDVKPSLAVARNDMERPWHDGCLVFESGTTPPKCVYGDPNGEFRVALIGDSHASALFPAVDGVARYLGWRLETYLKVNCPFIDMPVRSLALKREYTECADWRQTVLARVTASQPDLIIVTNSRWIHPLLAADRTVRSQAEAFARMIARLPGRVVIIADTPASDRDIPACLSANTMDIRPCAVPSTTAFSGAMLSRERLAASTTGARLINLTSLVCPSDPCPAVVRGMIVLRDTHHLTATFAASLAPALHRALIPVLPPTTSPTPAPTPTPTPTPPSSMPGDGRGLAPSSAGRSYRRVRCQRRGVVRSRAMRPLASRSS